MRRFFFLGVFFFGVQWMVGAPLSAFAATEIDVGQETAVAKIAIPLFTVSPKWSFKPSNAQVAKSLQRLIATQMKKSTFLEVTEIKRVIPLKSRAAGAQKTAKGSGVNGVLVGELRKNQLRIALLSGIGGRDLVRWILPLASGFSSKNLSNLANDVVNAVVEAIPYQGYVIDTRGKLVKINLGKEDALRLGQRLRIFEFVGKKPNFSSDRVNLGEVVVTGVRKGEAVARQVSGEEISKFAKVSLSRDSLLRLSAKDHVDSGEWYSIGVDVFSIETSFSDQDNLPTRNYDLSFSPFIALAGGWSGLEGKIVYGTAESSLSTVTFYLISAKYNLLSWGTYSSAWNLSLGATYRQFDAEDTGEQSSDPDEEPLESISGVHPFLDLRWSWVPRDKTKIYLGGKFMGFLTETGGDVSSAIASFGGGAYGGIRIDLAEKFGIEAGVEGQVASVALKNNFSFTESQLNLFWRSIILF